jgi:hypothetical protein
VKITSLLAQYLYKNHRLDLPGIGTFLLDPSSTSALDSSSKQQRSTTMEGVTFKSNPSLKDSPDLVAFISSQTGKMKALANADLESHIELMQQFLNIGKIFEFEGIGSLIKKRTGVFEFTPLAVASDKVKEYKTKDTAPVTLETSAENYESFLAAPRVAFSYRKVVMPVLVLCGITLAIWGGYTISKNAAADDTATVVNTSIPVAPPPVIDSTAIKAEMAKAKDYKYVLQVSKKQPALKRYNQLRTNLWDVKMETQDSVQYKLFLLLPAMNADTTHVMDSLTAMTGRRVYIDHSN